MGAVLLFKHYITVEIIVVLFCFTLPVIQFGTQDLLYKQICLRTANTTDLLCSNHSWIKAHKDIEGQTSLWSMYLNIATIVPTIISSIVQGSYIDRYQSFGLPINLPLVGHFIGCASLAVVAWTAIPYEFLLITMFSMGACGHVAALLTAVSTYVIHDSERVDKPFRIAMIYACLALAVTISFAAVGPVIDNLGLPWIFVIGAAAIVLALLDSSCRLRKPYHIQQPMDNQPATTPQRFLGVETIKSYLLVLTKVRENSKRLRLHLMTAVFILSFCAMMGVVDVEYLYLTKERDFTNTNASIFMSVSSFLVFLGSIAGTYVLSRRLGLHLTYLGMIGCLSSIVYYAGLSLATTPTALWIVNISKTFTIVTHIAVKTYVSGCVEPLEQGVTMSYLGVVEALFKLVATMVFNGLYPLTLQTWPGMVFMIAAAMCFLGLPILMYLRCYEGRAKDTYLELEVDRPHEGVDERT